MELALTLGITALVVLIAARHGYGMVTRIVAGVVAFVVSMIVMHVATVAVVVSIVIPRLGRGTPWAREVDAFMSAVFPGEWGKPRGD